MLLLYSFPIFWCIFCKKADIGMTDMSITLERSLNAQYSYPHTISLVSYVTSPPKLKKDFKYLYSAFDSSTWLLLFLSVIASITIIHLNWLLFKNLSFNMYLTVFEIILGQTSDLRCNQSTNLRILLISLMFPCSILMTIYSNLFYSLSVLPSNPKVPDTLVKLVEELKAGKITVNSFVDTSITDFIMVIKQT